MQGNGDLDASLASCQFGIACQDPKGAFPTHPAGVTEDRFSMEIFDVWAWIPHWVVNKEICDE